MRRVLIVVAASIFATAAADAQERRPFHVATFPDNRTISLAISSLMTPADHSYDFQVDVDFTERAAGGDVVFVDHGAHAVLVRCQSPEAVKVGGDVHVLVASSPSRKWMLDLWKALCLQPTS